MALLVWGLLFAYASSPAWANTITVNSTADPGADDAECTLREAITSANTDMASGGCVTGSGDDVINIGEMGTVTLTEELPPLTSSIEIKGPGANQFTVTRPDTAASFRIFHVSGVPTDVTISGMTISNGNVAVGRGGGIVNEATLTVSGSTISGNSGDFQGAGGGIANLADGTPTVSGSTISDNTAGGALGDGSSDGGAGGGIFSNTNHLTGVTTTITNSTISGNTAVGTPSGGEEAGGGVYNVNGRTVIKSSTITNNTAPNDLGSGVASFGNDQTSTEVLSSIISDNQGTDVDSVFPPTNSSFVSNGYNLIGDGNATGDFNQTGDQINVADPGLDALGSYGSPTQTHRLQSDSLALDAGPPSTSCPPPSTDQRLVDRPQAGDDDGTARCDIGSFELEDPTPNTAPTVSVAAGGTCTSNSGTINLRVADAERAPGDLTLSATSSNPALVPEDMISFGGTGAKRTMTATAPTGSGTSTLTVEVSDGNESSSIPIHFTVGTSASETLTGGADADMILARSGNDTATGKRANDLLCGGNGNDTLGGGQGRDTLVGGDNDDTLTGGLGADSFGGGSGTDTATDFNAG